MRFLSLLCALACVLLAASSGPSPKLSPADVIKLQLAALKNNDSPSPDAGIRAAFEFASPANRTVTGPIEKFTALLKNPLYSPLLNYRSDELGELRIEGAQAEQLVRIVDLHGKTAIYLFTLSKQKADPFKNCWMTDGVMRIPANAPETKIAD